ncbi:YueI family protein [Ornithinibacillus salinisoli]|uniref:YueI family protein n=1 Tax=Ornithinibacillus salinisoli TaxID=1848459 RepID=A0ABW4VX76_9BACI
MAKKNVEDYLTEGIYGTRLPKQGEREYFLGTFRERIVLALKKGQVMTDKGLEKLEEEMQSYKDATLIFNGHVSNKFLKAEKELADKYNIPYTVVTNEETETDIGAVLTYDYAIDREEIFLEETELEEEKEEVNESPPNFFSKMKQWFNPSGNDS